ncbi:hypothetical protein MTO96_012726 [Rhipicephalus appendiculatus]
MPRALHQCSGKTFAVLVYNLSDSDLCVPSDTVLGMKPAFRPLLESSTKFCQWDNSSSSMTFSDSPFERRCPWSPRTTAVTPFFTAAGCRGDKSVCAPDATHVAVLARHVLEEDTWSDIRRHLDSVCVPSSVLEPHEFDEACPLPSAEDPSLREVPSGTEICFLEPQKGFCGDQQTIYYYDQHSRSCKSFVFSGCGANENHFLTQEECVERCEKPLENARVQSAESEATKCPPAFGVWTGLSSLLQAPRGRRLHCVQLPRDGVHNYSVPRIMPSDLRKTNVKPRCAQVSLPVARCLQAAASGRKLQCENSSLFF